MSDDDVIYPAEEDDDDLTPLHRPFSEKNKARAVKRQVEARERIARREKLNIRFSEEEIQSIYAAAERNQTPVMPMLRRWVLAALAHDESLTRESEANASTSSRRLAGQYGVSERAQAYQPDESSNQQCEPRTSNVSGRAEESRLASIEVALHQLANALHHAGFTSDDQLSVPPHTPPSGERQGNPETDDFV